MLFNYFGSTKDYLNSIFSKIEKLYPNNIIGLNQSARYYSLSGNNEKAIKQLKKAYNLDKSDYIVIGNLGYMYELSGNYKEARKWYTEMSKLSDTNAKQYAQKCLDKIKDK